MQWLFLALTMVFELVVWTIGLVVAVLHLRTRRWSALMVIAALGSNLVVRVVTAPIYNLLPKWLFDHGYDSSTITLAFGVLSTLVNAVSTIAWALLIAAVFVQNPPPPEALVAS
ncbi:MAG: hypothetical protein ABMB14_07275 [Myxococcota bacterium]